MSLVQRIRDHRAGVLAGLVTVAALGGSGGWAWSERGDLDAAEGRADARQQASAAVREAVPELLGYSTRTLDRDVAEAQEWLTDAFRAEFTTLQDDLIRPAVGEAGFSTTAEVDRVGVVAADDRVVTLVVFVEQVTRRDGTVDPEPTATRATVRMERVGDRWLVGGLQPV